MADLRHIAIVIAACSPSQSDESEALGLKFSAQYLTILNRQNAIYFPQSALFCRMHKKDGIEIFTLR